MHREGHVGGALLAYAPAGAALAIADQRALALLGAAVMVALSMVPDWDHRVPGVTHRGVTHTVLFAVVIGGLVAWAGSLLAGATALGDRALLTGYGFFLGTLSILVHVAVDALTPAGVRPFWPLWRRRFSVGIVRAGNPVANYTLLTLGVLAIGVSYLIAAG